MMRRGPRTMKSLPIVLLLAGIAAGFFAGRMTSSTGEQGGGSPDSLLHSSGSGMLRGTDAMRKKEGESAGKEGEDPDGELADGEDSPRIAALKAAFDEKRGRRRNFHIQSAIYALNLEEIGSVWEMIEDRMESEPASHEWSAAFFARWAELDRKDAIAGAESFDGWRKSSALRTIALTWAESDPDRALAWAAEREDRNERSYIYNGVLGAIAATDKERAFDLAVEAIDNKLIDGGNWWGVGFFSEWAREDPARAAMKARELPSERLSDESLRRVMEVWARESPQDAMKWLDQSEDKSLRNRMASSIVEGWVKEEPLAAMEWALKDALDRTEPGLLRTSVRHFAQKDWEGAKKWVEDIEDESMRDEARLSIADRFNWEDPKKAAEYLVQFSDNPRFLSQLQNTTWTWSRADPGGAFDWAIENLHESNRRGEFLERIIGTWGEVAPDKAVNHLGEINEQRSREDAYQNVANNWANRDMEAARSWAEELEDGPEKDHALAGVVSQMAEKDPFGASEWLQTFPEGESRDRAVGSFVGRILQKDPESAWDWSQSITDPRRRAQSMENTARRLLYLDRETYEPMIRSSDSLSENAKWRLLDAD